MGKLDMNNLENFREIGFGLAIVFLLNRCLYLFAEWIGLSIFFKFLLFGGFGVIALLLGLFKFDKGLSFGLIFGAIVATRLALMYHTFKLTEFFQFLIALVSLLLLCFALYRLIKKNNK